MSRKILPFTWLAFAWLFLTINSQAQPNYRLNYINRYKYLAVREMERTGIPASIKLAQGILESNWGRSDLAIYGKNHFGIKCSPTWRRGTYYQTDDEFDSAGRLIESCFRTYATPEESYIAHSEFLLNPLKLDRYGFLFDLDVTDYKAWASGLKNAGYATNPRYHRLLISIIEQYRLFEYDVMSSTLLLAGEDRTSDVLLLEGVQPLPVLLLNDVKYTVPEETITVKELSAQMEVSVKRLLDYNEHLGKNQSSIPAGTTVFIQPKRKNYRGKRKWHEVVDGETMLHISNAYGIDLKKLYKRNRLQPGLEPIPGARIKLRGGKVDRQPRYINIYEKPAEDRRAVPIAPAAGSNIR